jgi:hypothetical protein
MNNRSNRNILAIVFAFTIFSVVVAQQTAPQEPKSTGNPGAPGSTDPNPTITPDGKGGFDHTFICPTDPNKKYVVNTTLDWTKNKVVSGPEMVAYLDKKDTAERTSCPKPEMTKGGDTINLSVGFTIQTGPAVDAPSGGDRKSNMCYGLIQPEYSIADFGSGVMIESCFGTRPGGQPHGRIEMYGKTVNWTRGGIKKASKQPINGASLDWTVFGSSFNAGIQKTESIGILKLFAPISNIDGKVTVGGWRLVEGTGYKLLTELPAGTLASK